MEIADDPQSEFDRYTVTRAQVTCSSRGCDASAVKGLLENALDNKDVTDKN